jgi:hypothetical protein
LYKSGKTLAQHNGPKNTPTHIPAAIQEFFHPAARSSHAKAAATALMSAAPKIDQVIVSGVNTPVQ